MPRDSNRWRSRNNKTRGRLQSRANESNANSSNAEDLNAAAAFQYASAQSPSALNPADPFDQKKLIEQQDAQLQAWQPSGASDPTIATTSVEFDAVDSQKGPLIATLDELKELDDRDKEMTAAFAAAETVMANESEEKPSSIEPSTIMPTPKRHSANVSGGKREREAMNDGRLDPLAGANAEAMRIEERDISSSRRFGDNLTNQPFASAQAQPSKKPREHNSLATKKASRAMQFCVGEGEESLDDTLEHLR
eukprot:scaffold30360_cov150-Skeletonema_dohrnii-CCMP3373.AAC.6